MRRLAELQARHRKRQGDASRQLARDNSEDGSAPQGGDLGWAAPGSFVPEFEEAMNALPLNGISDPVVSRFGVHLIQVLERRNVTLDAKQQREQARNVLREQKFEQAYNEWLRDLRGRAYVEMREPPPVMTRAAPQPAAARQHGGVARTSRKRFGQHFLADASVIDAIVDAIDPRPGEALVEIGPGLGALTEPLVERCRHADRDRARPRPGRAPAQAGPGSTVIEADVLRVDFAALARERGQQAARRRQPALQHLHADPVPPARARGDHIDDQHFMLQKEVVERMAAAPGGKDYGRLSVMLQWRYDIEPLLDVPPRGLRAAAARRFGGGAHAAAAAAGAASIAALLGELVTVAFSQRRKLLRHTLGRWLEERGSHGAFDLQRRAEEVPVAEYLAWLEAALRRRPLRPRKEARPGGAPCRLARRRLAPA